MQLDMAWMQGGFSSMANGGDFWSGAGKGFVTGLMNAGLSFLNVPGIIPNGLLHAGGNVLANGITNTMYGQDFFEGAGFQALTGFAGGAYTGYQLSDASGLNYWWGTDQSKWGYNLNQWSLAWWDKPDRIVFDDVKNRGAGKINCMGKSLHDLYGGAEQEWADYTFGGKGEYGNEYETMCRIRDDGGSVMKYSGDNEIMTYDNISALNQSGGRGMITVDNYRGSGEGHAMAVKKILYVPGKRFDVVLYDPYQGNRYLMRNFKQGTTLGQNLRFWFINL